VLKTGLGVNSAQYFFAFFTTPIVVTKTIIMEVKNMFIDIVVVIVLISIGIACYSLGRKFFRAASNRIEKIRNRGK